jgi:release factor glutamine methyltransferase
MIGRGGKQIILISETSNPVPHSAITAALRKSGSVFAEEEAQLLLSAFESPDELSLKVQQRIDGLPIQVILGWAEFHRLRVGIDPGVFIPRLRSEFLVDHAFSHCEADSIVVDLCCGSGAIGMAIISALPQIGLYASDNDPRAVHCARKNISSLGGHVVEGDLFSALPIELQGRVGVIVANAPYVPTDAIEMMPREAREHEPRESIDGGLDGLDVHRRIAKEANAWLAPGGYLLVETSEDQADLMTSILALNRLEPKVVSSDEYDATVVLGRKP